MNLFLFFLGICDQKDNHMHLTLWYISMFDCEVKYYFPRTLRNVWVKMKSSIFLPSIFFKLEYLKIDGMMAERYFCTPSCFFLFMKWEYHVSLCFHVDFLEWLSVFLPRYSFQGLWKPSPKSHSSFILCYWYWARNKVSASDHLITFSSSKTRVVAFVSYL